MHSDQNTTNDLDDFSNGHPELDDQSSGVSEGVKALTKILFGGEEEDEEIEPGYGPKGDPWALQDQNEVADSGETPLLSADEAKREKHTKRLRGLGQEVLDRLYDEHVFNADPRFAEVNKLIASGEPNVENMDEGVEVMKRLQEAGDFIEYVTKSLKLPQERIAAVTRYIEYRDMVEDFS